MESLQKEVKVYGFHSSLASSITELESSMETNKKSQNESTIAIIKMKLCAEEAVRVL